MSGHLAPFVAAVLRDQAVDEVVRENDRLKREASIIRIESADDSTLYAKADIRDGSSGGQGQRWHVKFDHHHECRLLDLMHIQIKLGGVPQLHRLAVNKAAVFITITDMVEGCYNEETGYGWIDLEPIHGSISEISIRCGPFDSFDHYSNLDAEEELVGNDLTDLGIERPNMMLRVTEITFELLGMLGYLDRCGIPESVALGRPTSISTDEVAMESDNTQDRKRKRSPSPTSNDEVTTNEESDNAQGMD